MTKNKKINTAIIALVMIVLSGVAFFVIKTKNDKDAKGNSKVEILNTLELEKGESVYEISINSQQNILLVSIMDENINMDENTSMDENESVSMLDPEYGEKKLIIFKKVKGKFQDPVTLDSSGYQISNIVSGEDSTVYFRGMPKEKVENVPHSIESIMCGERLFSAQIKEDKLTDIKEMDFDNDGIYVNICDIRADKMLISCTEYKKQTIELDDGSKQDVFAVGMDFKFYSCTLKDGEIITKDELTDTESLYAEDEDVYMDSLYKESLIMSFADTTDKVMVRLNDGIGKTKLFEISGKKWNKLSDVDLGGLKKNDRKVEVLNISDDGKFVYYVLADGSVCRAGYEEIKETKEKTQNNIRNTSYDEYDTSDFKLTLRNKGDKSLKQGVYYEIFVRSFADSDGDGIGDFNGVTAKLDYLKELGVDGIWLMPVNQSPSYHGYDITDYFSLNEDYGTEEDFKRMLTEAHARRIKVIMDFPVNHTSSLHPWFIEACSDENGEYRNYYRWVSPDDTTDFNKNDLSDWGSEVWHKSGKDYYYGIFSGSMPDLNYNNVKVRDEIKNAAAKWLELGVDGFRLDAAIHIYGDNEFKQQKNNLESNIQWWNEFASYCETINPNVYLVGEAWQNDEKLAEYVQPFDTKFNFSFEENMMESIIGGTAVTKDGVNLSELLGNILEEYKNIDENYLDGVFGTNHDQDRIMSQTKNAGKAKLAASIYMTLPGNPYIYYGEELGMSGEKPDENIRTPFIWSESGDMNTSWKTDNQNESTPSLEVQMTDESSMYNYYKKLIAVRKNNDALLNGNYTAVKTDNSNVMAYMRESENQKLLVIHNLSEENQRVDLNGYELGNIIYENSTGYTLSGSSINVNGVNTVIIELK